MSDQCDYNKGVTSQAGAAASSTCPNLSASIPGPLSVPAAPEPAETDILPHVQNTVASVSLGCRLDLKKIALRARNTEYKPHRHPALIMRIREPRATALIFSSGRILCSGARDEVKAKIATRRFARIIQKLGFDAHFYNFKIENMVASCDVGFLIRLEGLLLAARECASYEPELYAGLVYRMVEPRVTVLVFVSGKIVFTGGRTQEEFNDAFNNLYPLLKAFRLG